MKTKTDFWIWSFEQTGTNPLAWQHSAKDLIEGADAVKARVQDVGAGFMHSLAAVQAMLLGMALECLLKGMWIKKHKAWKNTTLGLTFGGKKPRIRGVGDHELRQLSDAAGVTLTAAEQALLQRLSAFVKFAGRYPIPMTAAEMRPVATGSGQTAVPGFISTEELHLAEALAARLMTEVEPWK